MVGTKLLGQLKRPKHKKEQNTKTQKREFCIVMSGQPSHSCNVILLTDPSPAPWLMIVCVQNVRLGEWRVARQVLRLPGITRTEIELTQLISPQGVELDESRLKLLMDLFNFNACICQPLVICSYSVRNYPLGKTSKLALTMSLFMRWMLSTQKIKHRKNCEWCPSHS